MTVTGQRFGIALATILVLCACGQTQSGAREVSGLATPQPEPATALTGVEAHFNPTEAAGGGANASLAISAVDLARIFAAVPNASKLDLTANSSPPGATGANVESISVTGSDRGSLLRSLDQSEKRALGDALLTAAAANWPNASVSLLLTDQSGVGGQIIGSRVNDGPNTLIVS